MSTPTSLPARAAQALAALALFNLLHASPSIAETADLETVQTDLTFEELVDRLKGAIEANEMFVVTQACASCGAAQRGVTIPGNMVIGVYRNDFAVRMLEASVPAGIEAPIRFYVTENDDGTATLHYRMPRDVFAPYGGGDLQAMAGELDQIWQAIVEDTVAK